jgi:hypothetical protein
MLVRLVVTGDLERSALGPSITRVFAATSPHLTIDVAHKLNELTTTRLPDPSNQAIRTPTPVTKMANALVTEALHSPRGNEADMVLGVADLELANADQPGAVLAWIRRAVIEEIDRKYPSYPSKDAASRARERVRDRCSFHLFVPLVEAYFFGERAALTRAGVPEAATIYRRGDDVEDFETDDPDFLPLCTVQNARKASHDWGSWREERHPKRYIDFLVERAGGAYSDDVGARALKTLDWPVVGALPTATRFARSLFEDLANLLGTANPLGSGDTHEGTYPAKRTRKEERVLRNL